VRLSYEFSERAALFTATQIQRFAIKLANLAVDTLIFNVSQSDGVSLNDQERVLCAVSEASQIAR